jgi:hypothetical protein
VIHIKLHDRRPVDHDQMGRTWVGYDPSISVEDLFEQNRGRWVLGTRADREKYAVFSYTGDHTVKFIAEIEGFEPFGNKRAMKGRVLDADHELSRRWLGASAPDGYRNPATYFREPGGGPTACACGCGEPVPASRSFVPGHDQRAIHARITRQWGGTVGFIDWFDATFPEE